MDIYFLKEYGQIYECIENGEFIQYNFQCSHGSIVHNFLKRKITLDILEDDYYDLATPYGYGGPIVTNLTGDKETLLYEFEKEFCQYCLDNRIISEFIRFHPILENQKLFNNMYNVEYNRDTALTIINLNENNFETKFSKSARKSVRRCLRDGLDYEIIDDPSENDIMKFREIYFSTLKRNYADDYYYFDEEYFMNISNNLKNNTIIINITYNNVVISSALYFVYEEFMHAHLSGTKSEYLNLSPAYLVKYAITLYAEKNKIKFIHHGGGTTSSNSDPLLKFKKKFTNKNTIPFYIGKKIYNRSVYQDLVKKTQTSDVDYFPKYRAKINT